MKHCDEILELISLRLDGALDTEQEQALAEHLNACPDCKALADDLAGIHAAMPDMNVPAPAFIMENVMERIRAEKSAVIPFPVKRQHNNHWRAWGATAAALVLVAAGAFALRGGRNTDSGNAPMTLGVEPSGLPATVQEDRSAVDEQALPIPAPTMETTPTATPEPFMAAIEPEKETSDIVTYGGNTSAADDAVPNEQKSENVAAEPRGARTYSQPQPTAVPAPTPQAPAQQPKLATTMMLPTDAARGVTPLTPAAAAQRLYTEKLAETYPGAELVEGEDFLGYKTPEMSLEYAGPTEDGAAYAFWQITAQNGADVVEARYLVPLDGGEIQTMDSAPAE